MKRKWRQVLSDWKEECEKTGRNYATLVKQAFPSLLKKLLEKDYSNSIISGFATCGLFPLDLEAALSRLPKEDRGDLTSIQSQLLKQLSTMRYEPRATTHAQRPKKKEKLPAGASWTCPASGDEEEGVVTLPVDVDKEIEDVEAAVESPGSENESERRVTVHNIISRLSKGFRQQKKAAGDEVSSSSDDNEESSSDEDGFEINSSEEEAEEVVDSPDELVPVPVPHKRRRRAAAEHDEQKEYEVGSYVAAVYQGDWYIGQVLDKKKEEKALLAADYLYLSFMERVVKGKDNFKWPQKPDKLNTLREDVLFSCSAPIPSNLTSTGRSITYSLPVDELKKANMLLEKAYYHTFFINLFWVVKLKGLSKEWFYYFI